MDILKNKAYDNFNYLNRYSKVPHYYNTVDDREISGIGLNMLKDALYTRHKIKESDTLEYLSLKYYNDPTFWWVIAYFNDIQDPFIILKDHFTTILIPNIMSVEFGELR